MSGLLIIHIHVLVLDSIHSCLLVLYLSCCLTRTDKPEGEEVEESAVTEEEVREKEEEQMTLDEYKAMMEKVCMYIECSGFVPDSPGER